MTKLELISQLLVEELHSFKKEVDRLEGIARDIPGIDVKVDSSSIERLLDGHLQELRKMERQRAESIKNILSALKSAQLIPKWMLVLFFLSQAVVFGVLGYFVFMYFS